MRRLTIAGLLALSAHAAYTWFYTQSFVNTPVAAVWTQNGTVTTGASGLSGTDASLIYNAALDGTHEYEAKARVNLTTSGGTYVVYGRATSNARTGPSATGTFYALELRDPVVTSSSCTAVMYLTKRVSNVYSILNGWNVACKAAFDMRLIMMNGRMEIFFDEEYIGAGWDNTITSGQPGVGVINTPAGNGIASAHIGPLDRIGPNPVAASTIATSSFPTYVDLRWQPPADDANGVGNWLYRVDRNGSTLYFAQSNVITDTTVSPGTTYTYTVWAFDFHQNASAPTTFSVTTPPANAIDPRQIGVRPTGTYWGAGPEKIDMRSGNLNITMPLFRVTGRGDWGVSFGLNYNSQNWRNEPSGSWRLGADIGYGFGWRLQAGALTPHYSGTWAIHHYTFTDGTGAEYRLDVNNGGVWTSRESVYVEYVPAQRRLYFTDGSYWEMNAESSGVEQDAGTLYPTKMMDTNGNFIVLSYKTGISAPYPNSSARLSTIEDVRSLGPWNPVVQFTYNNDAIPHLTNITSALGQRFNYTLGYWVNANLVSPVAPHTSHGQAHLLLSLTNAASEVTYFNYYNYPFGNAGELSQVNYPNGGYTSYYYSTYTFIGSRQFRGVNYRWLSKDGATPVTYLIERDPADWNRSVHSMAKLTDPSGPAKVWTFFTSADYRQGLVQSYASRANASPSTPDTQRDDYTWTTDAVGNPYIQVVQTATGAITTKRDQMLDQWGNVTQSRQYAIGNLSTPARTYTNVYLPGVEYANRRIRNRLQSTTLQAGAVTTTLVTNTYDGNMGPCGANPYCPPSVPYHDGANYGDAFLYRGNVSRIVTPGATKNIFYDRTGAVTRADDNFGHSVTITQSAANNYAAPATITASNLTTTFAWDTYLSPTAQTGPDGDDVTLQYDAYGRPIKTRTVDDAEWTISYSVNTTTRTKTLGASGLSRFTRTTVDGLGRTIKAETGDAAGVKSIVETKYAPCACSPLGKVQAVSLPYPPGTPTQNIQWTAYTYDELGRTKVVSRQNGASPPVSSSVTSYQYVDNMVTVTDPKGRTKTFTMDAFGNLVTVGSLT